MQLKLALQGKLSDVMEKHYSEGAKAVTLGISAATNGLNSRKKCDFCYFLVEINIRYVYSKTIVR